jgi:transposase
VFVKTTKAKGYTYISVVESFRDEKGITRHKVLHNFGRLDVLRADEGFINCVKKIFHMVDIPLSEDRDKVLTSSDCSEAELYNYGYLVYKKLWEILGIRECLETIGGRLKPDLEQTILLMAVQHLLSPGSKLSAYYGLPGIPLHHFFRALDKLADNKEKIERELFEINHLKLGQKVDIVFYEVTTLSFRGAKADESRNFGYGNDCKPGEIQVVMGLLLDTEGIPIGYELLPGNTTDGNTMADSLENLKKRFNIRKVIIVTDRGLNGECNLNLIKSAGYGYIAACRLRSMSKEIRNKVLDPSGYVTVNDDFTYKTIPYTNICKDGVNNLYQLDESLIVARSSKRAGKDAKDRQRLTEKAANLLKTPTSTDAQTKRDGNQPKWVPDHEKIADDSLLDGYYGIRTGETEMPAGEVMDAYHMLWKIEERFRITKSTMKVSPVLHWTPKRIRGHFLMCFLAFMMERKLENILAEPAGDAETASPEKIREALNSMQLAKVTLNGDTVYFKTKNLPPGTRIFRKAGIKMPMNVSKEEQLNERFHIPQDTVDRQISFL